MAATQRDSGIPGKNPDDRGGLVEFLRRQLILLGSLFAIVLGIAFFLLKNQFGTRSVPYDLLDQIGLGLMVAGAVTLIIDFLLVRPGSSFQERLLDEFRKDVLQQIDKLSLTSRGGIEKALQGAQVADLYATREAAAEEILQSVLDPSIREIRLLGVTLREFRTDGGGGTFQGAWRVITDYINGERERAGELDIRILIVDPDSFGAQLRGYGETGGESNDLLRGAVAQTIRQLRTLSSSVEDVRIAARLYHTAPILFMLATDRLAFVQPYYFWGSGERMPMPVFRFSAEAMLHKGLVEHFDIVWEHASAPLSKVRNHWADPEIGMLQAGALNVYTDLDKARERLIYLMNQANERIWLQGISLDSFCLQDQLHAALERAHRRGVDVRLLFLDPDSEQARYRSYREHLLQTTTPTELAYEEYCKASIHEDSVLVGRTEMSLRQALNSNFAVRVYDAAPGSFVAIIDDNALLEQYHYGSVQERWVGGDRQRPILGKEVPLVEFSSRRGKIAEASVDDPSMLPPPTTALLEDHFRFVFERVARDPRRGSRTVRQSRPQAP
jgi:hypothetical protein